MLGWWPLSPSPPEFRGDHGCKPSSLLTSLRAEDIVTDADTPAGTRAFKDYLAFARTGLVETSSETGKGAESDFEDAVGEVLRRRGFEITPQLGVAGYRIDIAVRHPDFPGAYLAAVECDGATYHAARSVRDRDRIRQEILESLGWKGRFWRVWSTNWFQNPALEADRLIQFLEDLRRTWKPEHETQAAWIEEGGDLPTSRMAPEPPPPQDDEPELEVRVGDTVRYSNLAAPADVITVQIAQDHRDLGAGVILRSAPIAQCLLGAVQGDEVPLRVPGGRTKQLRVIEIVRPAC